MQIKTRTSLTAQEESNGDLTEWLQNFSEIVTIQ